MRPHTRVDSHSPLECGTPHNIKHIMRDDPELAVVEILDNISIAFTEMRSHGTGLTREEARACQEGFTQYMDWQGLMVEREIHPLTIEEGTTEIDHHCHGVHGDPEHLWAYKSQQLLSSPEARGY